MITTIEELRGCLYQALEKEECVCDDFFDSLSLSPAVALDDLEKVATAIARVEVVSEYLYLIREVKSSDGILLQQWAEGACDVLEKELARASKNFPQSLSSSRLIAKMWLRNIFAPLCGREKWQ
jgi:hypothetical protein